MVKIDIVTLVKIDDGDPAKITLTSSYEAEVEYAFNKPVPQNGGTEIWVRAGTRDRLKLLTIKASAYPSNAGCPALSFKTLHRMPNGETRHSEAISLTADRYFDPDTSEVLYTLQPSDPKTEPELEAVVFTNTSNVDIDNVEVFVARDG